MRRNLLWLALALAVTILAGSCDSGGNPVIPDPTPTQKAPSIVLDWNETMLAAVRSGAPRPTVLSRSFYIASAAMYDAWAVYDDDAIPVALQSSLRRPAEERTEENQRKAVAYAAYAALKSLFGAYETNTQAFSTLLGSQGYGVNDTEDPTLPAGIGNLAAKAILAARADDGSNAANNFADVVSATYPDLYVPVNSADPSAPNAYGGVDFHLQDWCPLRVPTGSLVDPSGKPVIDPAVPASFTDQKFLTPQWGAVTPFAMASGDAVRPPAPPRPGSNQPYTDALGNTMTNDEAFKAQFDEVLGFSTNLTDERKVIAEYWMDGPRSNTPPGHWNELAQGIAIRDNHGIEEDVKMYLALNGAMMDAAIAAWDAKRAYNSCRPASAIRSLYAGQQIQAWGGSGQGTVTMNGENWRPYQPGTFVTPPFPDYVSGHSTFSGAAAEVLTQFTGSNEFYDGTTRLRRDYNGDGVLDMLGEYVATVNSNKIDTATPATPIRLQWATFQEAADEAGISRRYGGIHHQDADLHGRTMGKEIGELAFAKAQSLWGAD
jgi:hypothetical protein